MIATIPLIIVSTLIIFITMSKKTDIINNLILIGALLVSIIYLIISDTINYAAQLFLIVALSVIVPIVVILIIIIDYTSKLSRKEYASSYMDEIRRKAFHFVGFLVFLPRLIFWAPYARAITGFNNIFGTNINTLGFNESGYISFVIIIISYPLLLLFTITEFIRLNYKNDLFISLVRENESNRIASYLHTTTSIFIISLLFYPYDAIVCAAIAMGLLADLAAGIVGKKFHRIAYKDRSLEGCLANFAAGSIVGYFFVGTIAILVAFIIAIIDFLNGALELQLNDNFMFPLMTALLLYIFILKPF